MQVLVNGKWHDSETELIILELSAREQKQIGMMAKGATLYASYPEHMNQVSVRDELDKHKAGLRPFLGKQKP